MNGAGEREKEQQNNQYSASFVIGVYRRVVMEEASAAERSRL